MDIEHFTYLEFLKHTKNTPRASHNSSVSEDNGYDFSGTHSLEESYNFAYNGWDSGIKQLELEDGLLVGNGIEFNPSVHGSVVNIPGYLQGIPDSMYEMNEKREYNLEEITIYVQLNYSALHEVEDALNYTQGIIDIVNHYQRNYNVKIVGFNNVSQRGDIMVVFMTIKDFNQRFVLNNIAFSFHPGFFRRIMFRHYETKEYLDILGYGIPQQTQDTIDIISTWTRHNAIVVTSLNDMGGRRPTLKDIQKIWK